MMEQLTKWISKRRRKIMFWSSRHQAKKVAYSLLQQNGQGPDWSREAARTYFEAWLVSWQQTNISEARSLATVYEDEFEA
jgi:hypothetical protein